MIELVCSNCGAVLKSENVKVCANCGVRLNCPDCSDGVCYLNEEDKEGENK